MKNISRKHGKAQVKKNLDGKLDRVFDISACTCDFEIKSYSNRIVNCKIEYWEQLHIICICFTNAKVSIEDKAYLQNQRIKTEPKGACQLSSIDKAAIKRDNRVKYDEEVLRMENVKLPDISDVTSEPKQARSNSPSRTR